MILVETILKDDIYLEKKEGRPAGGGSARAGSNEPVIETITSASSVANLITY